MNLLTIDQCPAFNSTINHGFEVLINGKHIPGTCDVQDCGISELLQLGLEDNLIDDAISSSIRQWWYNMIMEIPISLSQTVIVFSEMISVYFNLNVQSSRIIQLTHLVPNN